MTSPFSQLDTVHARVGITLAADGDRSALQLQPYPALLVRGCLRISALVLMVDMGGGFEAHVAAGEDWTFTSDLSVRAPARPAPARITSTSRVLRAGRGSMSTEVRLLDESGNITAFGYAGFNRQTRRPGDNPKPDIDAASRRLRSIVPLDQPLADAAGVRVLDAATGATHTELVEALRNPAGALQGAMVSIVGEVAAEALLEHHGFTSHVITDIDIRYLAMGRVGPIGSRAWFIGDAGEKSPPPIAVELYDRGQDDRLITTLLLRAASTT